jgi:CelD/BcsL family acetyltransferase involved in cellulose biosynthesis
LPKTSIVGWREFLDSSEEPWLRLWQRAAASPDLSPMWAQALVRAHALDLDTVGVVVSRRGPELELVWPFVVKRRRVLYPSLTQIAPLQNVHCLHSGVLTTLAEEEGIRRVLGALRDGVVGWHWLQVEKLPVGSRLHRAWLDAARSFGSRVSRTESQRSPFIAHEGTFEELLAKRSKSFRKQTRALLRRRADDGIAVREFVRPEELSEYQAVALAIEGRSWKHSASSAITSRAWETAFYEQLIARFGPLEMLVGAVLYVDGNPAAHALDMRLGRQVFGLKTSFDGAYAKHRPGALLTAATIAYHFAHGCVEYDMLGNDEPYKLQWTDTTRDHVTLRVFSPSPSGHALSLGDRLYRLTLGRWRRAPEA